MEAIWSAEIMKSIKIRCYCRRDASIFLQLFYIRFAIALSVLQFQTEITISSDQPFES